MYDPGMRKAVQAAIGGAKDLATGVAMYVAHLVAKLQEKMGELSPEDLQMVVAHLCGSLISVARESGEPTASQNPQQVTKEAIQQCMQLLQQGQDQPDPNADPSQGAPMAQFSGAPQQGPPQ